MVKLLTLKDVITSAVFQSFVRMVYEPDNLYIAMEMMEPTPSKMKASHKNGRPIWEGNTAEVFINHGDMNCGYIQMIFNDKGDLLDAKGAAGQPLNTNFKTEAESDMIDFFHKSPLRQSIYRRCRAISLKAISGAFSFLFLLFSFCRTDAVKSFGKAAIFFKIGGEAGELSCQQKCFLIDQTDHRIGGDLLLNGVFVGRVRLVGQVGH